MSVARHLLRRAAEAPHQLAVVCPAGRTRAGRATYAHLTYRQLEAESAAVASALAAAELMPGTRVAMLVPPSLPFFAVTFGLLRAGLVPVFIDPGMGLKGLKRCLAEAAPQAFVGSPKAQLARALLGWCRGQLTWKLQVGGLAVLGARSLQALAKAATNAAPPPLPASDDPAAVLFTSGSTGAPKGALYRHATFEAQIAALGALFGIQPGEVDVCTFPLFALFAPALGMTAVVPSMDFTEPARVDPARLFEVIDDFGATNLFGSPALLRAVARAGRPRGVTLPSLRRVVSAGAPVSPRIVADFVPLLAPGAQLFTPYGATEALPVACIGSDEILGETGPAAGEGRGICVGRPAPGIDLALMQVSDGPVPAWSESLRVPQGQIGEIVVAGPQVTHAYHHRPEADALAKTLGGDGRVRHRMGDLGYLDERGRLWFCGRKAHRLATPTGELYTDPCEGVFNAHARVHRTALVGRGPRGQMTPVLWVEPDAPFPRRDERAQLAGELLTLARTRPATAAIQDIRFLRALPVDRRHNAKIYREKLKAMVDGGG